MSALAQPYKMSAYLDSVGITNSLLINPVFRLLIFGVVDLLRRVDRRSEVLKKVARALTFSVEKYIVRVVRAEYT